MIPRKREEARAEGGGSRLSIYDPPMCPMYRRLTGEEVRAAVAVVSDSGLIVATDACRTTSQQADDIERRRCGRSNSPTSPKDRAS